MLQDYCRKLGVGTSDRDVAELMAVLKELPQHHPLRSVLSGSRDAVNANALADALLNPRDRAYSVPQLLDLIERNGLRFERWYWQAPYLPHCGAIATTPHADRLSALPRRDQFAALELWRGTMTAHSAVLHRTSRGQTDAEFRFDPASCANYVPLRLPSTLCIQEPLPAGAAAVLLNRSHPYPDLILTLDAEDKRIFDAIDGRRTVAETAEHARGSWPRARSLFEKLWWYDQVVFDASGVG
jgi:hypothetical protein